MRVTPFAAASLAAAAIALAGCSSNESSGAAANGAGSTASSGGEPAASTASSDSIVRGTVVSVSDSVLTLAAPSGELRIALAPPVTVYTRENGDLARVTDNSFVGVTSVPQPDGTQRATEIHVFPDELRGLGEGSRPMAPQGGAASKMTNGTVAGSRMTNGAAQMANGSARMTNGASHGAAGGTMTVQYAGGSQTITVPSDVPVTVIAPTSTKLAAGATVVALATRQPDGTLRASRVLLAGKTQPPK